MDNNNNSFVTISPIQNINLNNEINNERRDYHKMIISTIIYICIIPFLFFLIARNNPKNFPYIIENDDYIINNNINDINNNIETKIRNLGGENIYVNAEQQSSNRYNSSALEEEIKTYLKTFLEKLGKNYDYLNELTSFNNPHYFSKESLYLEKDKQLFISRISGNTYKGTWKSYPYNPYTQKEKNFENFYEENYSEINTIYYLNSSQKKFKVGKEQSGTAYVNFKKAYQKNTRQEALAINIKNLEGNYVDNWIEHLSFIKFSNIQKVVDEKRNKYYFRGEFTTTLSTGQIFYKNKNFLNAKKTCPSLIEVEFPLSQVALYILYGNKTEPPKIIHTINNKNFSMVLSSQCGFRIKIDAVKYDTTEEMAASLKTKELYNYFWMNIIISILNFFSYSFVTYSLNKHQDTVSAFSILCLSQNIAWHSYRSLSDINLGLNYPYFFGPFMLMALFPLINFIGFDLRLLLLYWRINKRILSNRQFIVLRLRFFFIFYFLMFCSFFLVGEFYFNKTLIWISAVFLWTPQIFHNIKRYNKYVHPLLYILVTTADRMIIAFYFRGYGNNFLKIKTDKNYLIYVTGYIFGCIFIIYLQVFLGPRFMLCKKYKRKEIDFHRTKAQILREKPDSINEECTICLCPLFNIEEAAKNQEDNNKNVQISENDDNKTNTEMKMKIPSINKSYNSSVDIMNSNQINSKTDDILDVANKKKLKLSKKMNLYKNKVNPIIIKNLHLGKKSKFLSKKRKVKCSINIIFILKSIFCNNFLFFYKYQPNKANQKYMLLKCGHIFHTNCIEKWFEMKKECPSCRASMENYI